VVQSPRVAHVQQRRTSDVLNLRLNLNLEPRTISMKAFIYIVRLPRTLNTARKSTVMPAPILCALATLSFHHG
jgi:hypothetical protein